MEQDQDLPERLAAAFADDGPPAEEIAAAKAVGAIVAHETVRGDLSNLGPSAVVTTEEDEQTEGYEHLRESLDYDQLREALMEIRAATTSLAFAAPEMQYLHLGRIEAALDDVAPLLEEPDDGD